MTIAETERTPAAETEHNAGRQILLVEDEAIIAMAEKSMLENAGYEVSIAHTGEEAVDAADTRIRTDLVLMDINLGRGIDGTEAASRILEKHDVPLVFLSAHTEPAVVEKTEGITSYGYVVKNSGDTVLLASIRMAFRLHEARQEVKAHCRIQQAMLGVSRNLAATRDLQTILQTASDRLAELSGLDSGAIYLLRDGTLMLEATTPPIQAAFPEEFRNAPLADHAHIREAVRTAAPVFIGDTDVEPMTAAERAITDLRNLKSILYVPLTSPDNTVGVFITGSTGSTVTMSDSTVDLCTTLANMTAVAIENALVFERCGEHDVGS